MKKKVKKPQLKKVINMNGLSYTEVKRRQKKYGFNEIANVKDVSFFVKVIDVILQPFFLILLLLSGIYALMGQYFEAGVLLGFVVVLVLVQLVQIFFTDRRLKRLRHINTSLSVVIRHGRKVKVETREIVPGDLIYLEKGVRVPADGVILKMNGLCIDEATFTGEATPIYKSLKDTSNSRFKSNWCYAGSVVLKGDGIAVVEKTGYSTEYGKIGKSLVHKKKMVSPLKRDVNRIIEFCSLIAIILFFVVGGISYYFSTLATKERIANSLVTAFTASMAAIPSELSIILVAFLSIGAYRLAKKKSLIRRLSSIEVLGEVSTLCVDKTGTITASEMKVDKIFTKLSLEKLAVSMARSSMDEAMDSTEEAIVDYCRKVNFSDEELFSGNVIHNYPFTNKSKMMGKVWNKNGNYTLYVKGSYEKVLGLCDLTDMEKEEAYNESEKMSKEGYRVIAVAKASLKSGKILDDIEDYTLDFCGLVGLINPPRKSIKDDVEVCQEAGIKIMMITGDSVDTACSVAEMVGINNFNSVLSGDDIDKLSDDALKAKIEDISVCARVLPEHKTRIVKALQARGEIVAMSGDGANDAPALKQADVGIAMGKNGSDLAKDVSDIVLLDDNFSTIVDTIVNGRRIYDNIKKAISYLLIIHLSIILSILVPVILKVPLSDFLFLPIHIALLSLIIGPTASIAFERQPSDKNIMKSKPRSRKDKLLSKNLIIKNIIQGLSIFIFSFGLFYTLYYYNLVSVKTARTLGIVVLLTANIFLVQVNASNNDFSIRALKSYLKDIVMWIIHILTIACIYVLAYTKLGKNLYLEVLPFEQLLFALVVGFISVYWYEIVKYWKKD